MKDPPGASGLQCALVFACVSLCKLLLSLQSYRSTDFEVHRNWLAVTWHADLKDWYFEDTSEWTLDYPPLFAYFERLLAQVASWYDGRILALSAEPVESAEAVLFQRVSVVAADAVLALGAVAFARASGPAAASRERELLVVLLLQPGLLLVDHVHFQYNGLLLGLLLLSLAALRSGRAVLGGALFTALLCAKHLFLSLAPLYFTFLLRMHVFRSDASGRVPLLRSLGRFLAVTVGSVALPAAAILAPVLAQAPGPLEQLRQLAGRLFPWGRGLVHAYWAPNAWALYLSADRLLARYLGLSGARGATGGLVHVQSPEAVLPGVTPPAAAALCLAAQLPLLRAVWSAGASGPRAYERAAKELPLLAACASLATFYFGWHVHEKASLVSVVPLLVAAATSEAADVAWLCLSATLVSTLTLFPLFFTVREAGTKVLAAAAGLLATAWALRRQLEGGDAYGRWRLRLLCAAGLPLAVFCEAVHPLALADREDLAFLPLMLYSAFGAAAFLEMGVSIFAIARRRLSGASAAGRG